MFRVTRLAAIAMAVGSSMAYAQAPTVTQGAMEIGGPVEPVVIDARRVAPAPDWRPGDPIREVPMSVPKGWQPPVPDPRPVGLDPLVDAPTLGGSSSGGPNFDTPAINVAGSGFSGVNPSDTVGDVGNDHYIQIINNNVSSRVLILNKTNGATVSNFLLNTLAAGSGTGCSNGNGDPTVNFDETVDNGPGNPAGRWVLMEFTDNSVCVYVSQTADPTTGQWFLYEFLSVTGGLPDYPKIGVWPDGYYMGTNPGPRQYVFDRQRMLAGQTARPLQAFLAPGLPGFGFQHMMPVDWDGDIAPPIGAPGLFVRHRDDEIHNVGSSNPNSDILELWELRVNWDTPAQSTFTGPINVASSEFDSEFCNLAFSGCLPQPTGSTTLFALLQPIMWRAQYRNFGDHESLVANMVTDVDGADTAGVRWFELRRPAGSWVVHDEDTVSRGDSVDRWMASVALDEAGNLVAGYNVVSGPGPNVFPGMRYSGRLVGDPAGTTPRGEVTIINGATSNASIRYGDYSALAVDPVDGCTFWYTAQHNQVGQWATRIASFRFDACGLPAFYLASPVRQAGVCTETGADNYQFDVNVNQVNGFSAAVTLALNPPPPPGITGAFGANPVTPPGSTTLSGAVDQTVAAGSYPLTVLGTASGAGDRTLGYRLDVYTQTPPQVVLSTPADATTAVNVRPTLTWQAAAQATTYVLEIDDSAAFDSIDYTRTVTGTSHAVETPLANATTYRWRVRAINECGTGSNAAVFTFVTRPAAGDCPAGVDAVAAFSDNVEGGANGWTHSGNGDTWAISTQRAFSGASSWKAVDPATPSDQLLVSPPITLPAADLPISLQFQTWQHLEIDGPDACWDGGRVEVSTDNGATWTAVGNADLVTLPYDGAQSGGTPIAGQSIWCSEPPRDWTRAVVALDDYAGQTVRLRFRMVSDTAVGREGMYVDDIRVQSCPVDLDAVFEDGFEN
jgi:hypothetical protein